MKQLIIGITTLLLASLVSCLQYTIGLLYSFAYSVWLSITLKKWYAFIMFWIKTIDGFLHAIGHALYHIAYAMDLSWNVNGEILEDMITSEENTTFTQKGITVSASVGKLEIENKLNWWGKISSKILNIVFNQKKHAIDSWLITEERKKLTEKYFQKK